MMFPSQEYTVRNQIQMDSAVANPQGGRDLNPKKAIYSTDTDGSQGISLKRAIRSFTESLGALRDFVSLVGSALTDREQALIKQHREDLLPLALAVDTLLRSPKAPPKAFELGYAKLRPEVVEDIKKKLGDRAAIEVTEEGRQCVLTLRDDDLSKGFTDAVQKWGSGEKHKDLLYRSALISLISSAEWFIAQVIRQHLEEHPEIVVDRTLTLRDLKSLGSVVEAQRLLIDSRVDDIIRGSFEDWLRYLKESLKVSAAYLDKQKDALVEIFQRRNLIVHNNGVINSLYLNKIATPLRKPEDIGKSVRTPPEYLSAAIDLVEVNFILIGAELWKKLRAKDEERADILIDISFEHLKEARWSVAEGLSHFLMNDKQLSERSQIIGQLNYWQCKKWQQQFESVQTEVEAADFSAKDELYQLARYALLDDAKGFFKLLPSLSANKKLSLAALRTWPIFRGMRSHEEYTKLIETRSQEYRMSEGSERLSGRHSKVTPAPDQGNLRKRSPAGPGESRRRKGSPVPRRRGSQSGLPTPGHQKSRKIISND